MQLSSISIYLHQPYISPLSVLERLDPALGVNGTMKSGKQEVAQVVRYEYAHALNLSQLF